MQRPPWLGKLIGAVIGYVTLGAFGLVLGLFLGHLADAVHRVRRLFGPALQAVQGAFFETTFTLMGRVAKCDGRISEHEIAVTEQLMVRMGLSADHRQQAIGFFKRGAAPDFDVDGQLDAFMVACSSHPNLRQMLLVFLFSTAFADGSVSDPEHELLRRVAARIGYSGGAFEQLFAMFRAQERFSGAPGTPEPERSLADAYAALGIPDSASDREAKHAYRKLMSQYHPDKLIAEGMPEDMVKMATERTQEIQNAWEQIRSARGI